MDSPAQTPALAPRFLQPDGWRWHVFTTPEGRKLRFGTVAPKSKIPDAVVVILPGLGEFGEKYYELAHDFLDRNLSVWVLDWRGQGQSDRYLPNREKRHSAGFDADIADLHFFLMEYVKHAAVHPDVGRIPMVMLGHSMGGNLGLRYLLRHPENFTCAAFTAPMTGIAALQNLPLPVSLGLASILRALCAKAYVPGAQDWTEPTPAEIAAHPLSHDAVRNNVQAAWMRADPQLRVGGVTFGWVYAALKSCFMLARAVRRKPIEMPCLFALAGADSIVSNKSTRAIAAALPQGPVLELPGAYHEIIMEKDAYRGVFLNAFMTMLVNHNIREKLKRF